MNPKSPTSHFHAAPQSRAFIFTLVAYFTLGCASVNAPLFAGEQTASCAACDNTAATLASWNDTATKKALVTFVENAVNKSSSGYIAPKDRVAVFDNDGTLWSEQPLYFQVLFAIDRVKELAQQHPDWATKEPYAAAIKGDLRGVFAGGEKALMEIVAATHTGLSDDDFRAAAAHWLATARHPKFNRPYTECVFQPMLEVLGYLRANGFKTYIVSGGELEFMRAFAEKTYGIPPEQVVGTTFKTEYKIVNGLPTIQRLPALDHMNDNVGKPVGIAKLIGRHPVLAFGNSDGDFEMLEYTTKTPGAPRLGFIVHHTDAEREFAYDRQSHIGKLDRGLDAAAANGWILIDMKNDWKTIYPSAK